MQLRTIDGRLTLGSVFRLVAAAWLTLATVFMALIVVFLIPAAFTNGLVINGQLIRGGDAMGQVILIIGRRF